MNIVIIFQLRTRLSVGCLTTQFEIQYAQKKNEDKEIRLQLYSVQQTDLARMAQQMEGASNDKSLETANDKSLETRMETRMETMGNLQSTHVVLRLTLCFSVCRLRCRRGSRRIAMNIVISL